jgi:hypothetical protein
MTNEEIERFLVIANRWRIAAGVLEFIGIVLMSIAATLLIWRGYVHFFQ